MDPISASIKESFDEIVMVKDVWDTSMLCELQFTEWRNTLWNDIRTEVMEDGAKGFVKVRGRVITLNESPVSSLYFLTLPPSDNPRLLLATFDRMSSRSTRRSETRTASVASTTWSRTSSSRCLWWPTCAALLCVIGTGSSS